MGNISIVSGDTGIKFGCGFCEASGPCLVRHAGNDEVLEKMAGEYGYSISAGHSLVILLKDAFPINVLTRLKEVPEIVTVYHKMYRKA